MECRYATLLVEQLEALGYPHLPRNKDEAPTLFFAAASPERDALLVWLFTVIDPNTMMALDRAAGREDLHQALTKCLTASGHRDFATNHLFVSAASAIKEQYATWDLLLHTAAYCLQRTQSSISSASSEEAASYLNETREAWRTPACRGASRTPACRGAWRSMSDPSLFEPHSVSTPIPHSARKPKSSGTGKGQTSFAVPRSASDVAAPVASLETLEKKMALLRERLQAKEELVKSSATPCLPPPEVARQMFEELEEHVPKLAELKALIEASASHIVGEPKVLGADLQDLIRQLASRLSEVTNFISSLQHCRQIVDELHERCKKITDMLLDFNAYVPMYLEM